MTYVISRAKIWRCGGQIDTSLAWRRLDEAVENAPTELSQAAREQASPRKCGKNIAAACWATKTRHARLRPSDASVRVPCRSKCVSVDANSIALTIENRDPITVVALVVKY